MEKEFVSLLRICIHPDRYHSQMWMVIDSCHKDHIDHLFSIKEKIEYWDDTHYFNYRFVWSIFQPEPNSPYFPKGYWRMRSGCIYYQHEMIELSDEELKELRNNE